MGSPLLRDTESSALMSTISSRIDIGFAEDRKTWSENKAIYDEHTLRIAGHPVMEDWELGYMHDLAKIASRNGGRVLELGFGLGLSAKAIQKRGIKDHYLIECHPDVIARAAKDMHQDIANRTFHLLTGFWEDVTPLLADGIFDGILFDTYPLSEAEIHKNHFWFFEEAYRLLKPGGVFTYYSDEANDFSPSHKQKLLEAGFREENITFELSHVEPPEDCEYWKDSTFISPIIIK
ncbi:Guanidinoacetate N-methyltransferase [Cladobotryum mycophilum]|uniref:Guanidinoacetate N-methyltransferase n=1 Tax=Cladobotryum mycophilum TaxID=491253 RepID=A0ABR0SIV7_9HYPO